MKRALKLSGILGATLFTAGMLVGDASLAVVTTGVNVTTYHYDTLRTGWNNAETALTPQTVAHGSGGATFKMTKFVQLDEQVDAQPLLVTGQTIQGKGVHDVVYVATENDSIYAIDASSGQVLLQKNYGPAVPIEKIPGGCSNNSNNVGIGSTPVIDTAHGVMYFIAYSNSSNVQKYILHEVNLTNLVETVAPVRVSAKATLANGHTVYRFNDSVARQRAALLMTDGNVYAAFASFCDFSADQSRGWVLGWNQGTLAPLAANDLTDTLVTTPDNYFLSSVWMSGYGLASNSTGDIYFVTGNSDYSGTTLGPNNIAESSVQLSSDLTTVKSTYLPSNASDLDQEDGDFGSGGLMLLPPQPGQTANMAVAAGKDGNMYFMNADNLTNHTTGDARAFGTYGIGGCWCGASYFTGTDGKGRVVSSGGGSVGLWLVHGSGAHPTLTNEYFGPGIPGEQAPGFMTAVSSNGSSGVVIWAVGHAVSQDSGDPTISLYAFNGPTGAQIFSGTAGFWPNTNGTANIAPVVANGHVYVATYEGLAIYGLSSGPAAVPALTGESHATRRIALAPGQHEIFGTVTAINGWNVTVAKRDGSIVTVNTLSAAQHDLYAAPSVGRGISVRGTYTATNMMTANVVLHANGHPRMWQSDR